MEQEKIVEVGSKGGMDMRTGQITEVGCTERIRKINGILSNPGSHFVPDYHEPLAIGYQGYYEKCRQLLENMDPIDPANVGKRDF